MTFSRLSLKVRVTLFGVLILIAVVSTLTLFAGQMLRADTKRLVGEQQLSMTRLIAAQIDERVADRLRALSTIAAAINPEMLADPKALQAMLERREVLVRLFNRGSFVVDVNGIAVASVPLSSGRTGLDFMDSPYTVAVLQSGKPLVGQPTIGKMLGRPVFHILVPIKTSDGKVIGALMGATDIGAPNFLDIVTSSKVGRSGGYVIFAPESRLIVTASDKTRVMEQFPALGVNPAIDRFGAQDEGSAVLVDLRGVEVLASLKTIPSANWQLLASVPMDELLEPIIITRYRLVAIALPLTAIAALVGWMGMRRELDPLAVAAKQLAAMASSGAPATPLAMERDDEIGALFTAFNSQLALLKAREDVLSRTSELAKIAGWEMDLLTGKRTWSRQMLTLLEIDPPVTPATMLEVERSYGPATLEMVRTKLALAIEFGTPWDFEMPVVTAKGRPIWVRAMGIAERIDGKTVKLIGTSQDVTYRREIELALQESREFASDILKTMGLSVTVIDADARLTYVNPAAAELLGLPAEQLLGMVVHDFIDDAQRLTLIAQLRENRQLGMVSHETNLKRADGKLLPVSFTSTRRWKNGEFAGAITVMTDLGERRKLESELQREKDFARQVVQSIGQGLLVIDGNEKFEYVNPAYAKLLGLDANALIGRSPSEFAAPSARLAQVDEWAKRRRGETSTYETVLERADGGRVEVSITATPRFRDDQFVGSIGIITELTERRKLEKLVREQRDFARHVLDTMAEGISVVSADGRFEFINRAYAELLGWDADDLIGTDRKDVTPPEEAPLRTEQWYLRKHGVTSTFESAVMRRDGTRVPVEITAAPRFMHGEFIGSTCVITDLTQRREFEQQLREQSEFAEGVISAMGQGVGVSDHNAVLIYANQAYAELLGRTVAQVVGCRIHELLPPDASSRLDAQLQRRSQGESGAYESERLHADGHVVPVWINAAPRYVEGKYAGSIAVITDLTEQRRAERILRASEARFRSLMEDVSGIAVQGYRLDGTVIFWNRASEMLYGYSAKEAMGANLLDLIIPPEMKSGVRAAMAKMARSLMPIPAEELVLRRKDGAAITVFSSHALTLPENREPEFFCLDIDLSSQKEAEAAREVLEEKLRQSQKMEAIGTLAGGIAHDFNNILATILGNVDLARHIKTNDAEVVTSLEEIRKAGTRARDLVGQILSFSRRQATDFKNIDLKHIINESARLLRTTMPANIALEVECQHSVPMISGDATQLQQIVMNLVTNAMQAIRAAGSGSGKISIQLDMMELDAALVAQEPLLTPLYEQHAGAAVRLSIIDDGPGMDAATLARLFEPFFTTKNVDEGTGLGLAVVYGIVRGHGGLVTVKSEPGEGAAFILYFAVASGRAVDASQLRANAERVGEGSEAESKAGSKTSDQPAPVVPIVTAAHVLYLDDDEALTVLVTRLLERRGYRVTAYTNQREALNALNADPAGFDLVVTDYNMPGMSGLDVARAIRTIRADLPVAVASGFVDEKLQTMSADAGVLEIISKANVVEELCDAVQRLLNRTGD